MSIINQAPKWYNTEDASIAKKARKAARPQALRASIVPGSVLIILAGRFRGKRVVCLKALEDNTLLVSGPFKINGVPLRRVNPRYVIATSTKVSVESLSLDKYNVEYFSREKKSKKSNGEKEFFGDNAEKKEVKAERVADQKAVDAGLLAEIKKISLLKQYLASSFSLKNGDRPHALKF
ncbi:60S ribosomal protein L6-B [Nadsonia fulvescens var. elongata DSM 6958]|uniref:60S ribosomal protein L6 n=1 Tax=Nadsonia fulvescens var. elongata DSM 6958 TaxID=857566 RepID=A0A1E3PQ10_9ASCO|nr:60S ribosomal protein L6-B [Nadsonia fulvescens var. elongata DSM 6958]